MYRRRQGNESLGCGAGLNLSQSITGQRAHCRPGTHWHILTGAVKALLQAAQHLESSFGRSDNSEWPWHLQVAAHAAKLLIGSLFWCNAYSHAFELQHERTFACLEALDTYYMTPMQHQAKHVMMYTTSPSSVRESLCSKPCSVPTSRSKRKMARPNLSSQICACSVTCWCVPPKPLAPRPHIFDPRALAPFLLLLLLPSPCPPLRTGCLVQGD